jgi:hypothetical protein
VLSVAFFRDQGIKLDRSQVRKPNTDPAWTFARKFGEHALRFSAEKTVTSLSFCPTLERIVRKRSALGRSGKPIGIGGMSTVNNLITLRHLHLETRAERTLEVGLACAGSGLIFTQTHKDLGRPPSGQHVAIDPWQSDGWLDESGLLAIENAGLSGYLDFKPQPSSLALPLLFQGGAKFDLAYIDGSHLFEDVFLDAYYVVRLLNDGGIVAFDDSCHPDVRKVLRFIRRNLQPAVVEIDLGSYRDRDDFRYKFAKALGRTQLIAFRRAGDPERRWDAELSWF